jgi:hypothetical protein
MQHSQIPAVVTPTRSRKREHELRAPMNVCVGRLVHKRMSLSLAGYTTLLLLFTFESLSVLTALL